MKEQDKPAAPKQTIVMVDDNVTTLNIARNILRNHYDTYALPSGTILFNLLEKITPDLILLDIEMPGISGYEAIKRLKADKRLSGIPVIFVTSRYDEGSELEGLSLGAIDYITKPFSPPLLLRRIKNHLLTAAQEKELKNFNANLMDKVNQKATQIIQMQFAILNVVAELVEFRDRKTGGHIARTQQYLELLLKKMLKEGVYLEEISSWDLTFLIPSAQLHDVGKIAISDTILNKPGKLTPEEFDIMKTHVTRGIDAIERIEHETHEDSFLYHAKCFAGYHHEKWDGTGYPHGLAGKDIPLQGRLMAIADVYDALISSRPYKEEMPLDVARSIILDGNGKHFDPILINVFRNVVDGFEEIATSSRNKGDSFIFKWTGAA
ncbi:MAG: response regulator [Azoarcus sp.]|jgi:putative two-component system response regulator|nr:response regulator [Azoarcus sp.]